MADFDPAVDAVDSAPFDEACEEIRDILQEAWTRPKYERRHIIRRQMVKWHPNKNPDNVEYCTHIFNYIKSALRHLETGQQLPARNPSNTRAVSFNETCERIRNILQEAWTRPEAERRKIVKRLMLKWHPDKNHPDNVKYCTEIFGYIQSLLRHLETGQQLPAGTPSNTEVVPLHETKEKIRDMLQGAWALSESERKRIIRRLIIKWHPDKNPDMDDVTRVTDLPKTHRDKKKPLKTAC